ncbi:TM0106 family RecB-like putative nuclease [Bradyrhizobium barranii]
MAVTASILYNLVECPQRVALDAFGDPARRDNVSAFVRLLWERGTLFEQQTVANLKIPFVDLSNVNEQNRERLTLDAMTNGQPLIYGGCIRAGDLLGKPDLLRREVGGYVPGDIKSGRARATEGADEDHGGRPKRHYAVQLGLYVDVLERLNLSAGRRAFVLDIQGDEVEYDFRDPSRLWGDYQKALASARSILAKQVVPTPGYGNVCKLCHWHTACLAELTEADDLTLIPLLRRSDRDSMRERIATISAFSDISPREFIRGKKTAFAGIGADRFRMLHARAVMLKSSSPKPYLRLPIKLDVFSIELFFDIEVDPLRGICYLHGFVERRNGDNKSERFEGFFADEATRGAERDAFAGALDYLNSRAGAGIYYYSKYERTIYRKLQQKYPDICSPEYVEKIFDPQRAVDLYGDVVLKATEWPTRDHSIKSLAKFLGFAWRDIHPSGAASIEWYDRWCRGRDPLIRQRILDYNEDDCRATRVLLDGIRALTVATLDSKS